MAQSIRDIPKRRGRPKTTGRGEAVIVRMHGPALNAVDAWASKQSDPKPTRPEAIRRLVSIGLCAAPPSPLAQQLARVEQKLARKIPAKTSPAKGMAVLRKGLAEVEHRKLVEKKKMVDTSGQIRAGEPELESRPKQATGKKGGDVQGAKLPRRARAAKVDPTNPRRRKP